MANVILSTQYNKQDDVVLIKSMVTMKSVKVLNCEISKSRKSSKITTKKFIEKVENVATYNV